MPTRCIALRLPTAALVLLACAAGATAAVANGADFFPQFAQDQAGSGSAKTLYFGYVRDQAGKGVANADVVIAMEDQSAEYTATTDVLGVYRSTEVPAAIDPSQVNVVILAPAGYALASRIERSGGAKPGNPVEVDFVLKYLPGMSRAR